MGKQEKEDIADQIVQEWYPNSPIGEGSSTSAGKGTSLLYDGG